MITNPKAIKLIAHQKERENLSFFSFIKKEISSRKFDELLNYWGNFYTENIDCTTCANCCKILNPSFSKENIEKYENILSMEIKEKFISTLYLDLLENRYIVKCNPCPLLNNNLCQVYANRPASCANFPHLNSPNQKYRIRTLLTNYEICPIVFNTIEKIKEILIV